MSAARVLHMYRRGTARLGLSYIVAIPAHMTERGPTNNCKHLRLPPRTTEEAESAFHINARATATPLDVRNLPRSPRLTRVAAAGTATRGTGRISRDLARHCAAENVHLPMAKGQGSARDDLDGQNSLALSPGGGRGADKRWGGRPTGQL